MRQADLGRTGLTRDTRAESLDRVVAYGNSAGQATSQRPASRNSGMNIDGGDVIDHVQ